MKLALRTSLVSVACLVAACDDDLIEIGVIEQDGPAQVEVPASARVGEPVRVRVMTIGNSCVSVERTDVDLADDGADITPYDRRQGGNCTMIQLLFEHDATVRFETPGGKEIRIHGRKRSFSGGQIVDEIVQRSFTLTIEP